VYANSHVVVQVQKSFREYDMSDQQDLLFIEMLPVKVVHSHQITLFGVAMRVSEFIHETLYSIHVVFHALSLTKTIPVQLSLRVIQVDNHRVCLLSREYQSFGIQEIPSIAFTKTVTSEFVQLSVEL
jgi:hypothetical protein